MGVAAGYGFLTKACDFVTAPYSILLERKQKDGIKRKRTQNQMLLLR